MNSLSNRNHENGFTLIEFLLMAALFSVIMTLAVPVYSNYSIRTRLSESMEVIQHSSEIVSETCRMHDGGKPLKEALADNDFIRLAAREAFIREIKLDGNCMAPVLTVITKNTGQLPNPVLLLTAVSGDEDHQTTWRCSSENTSERRLPQDCRS